MIGFFQTFCLYAFFYISMNSMRASTGAIIQGLDPLVTALIAHFFMPGDRLNFRRLISMFLGGISVLMVTAAGRGSLPQGGDETFGIILMGLALISNATAVILVARSSDDVDPFILTSAQLAIGGLFLLVAGLATEGVPRSVPPWYFFPALLWLSGITSGGFSIWYYLLKVRKETVSYITVWKFLIPVAGPLLAWIFIGNDQPSLLTFGGMFVTALAIMLFYSKKAEKPIPEREEA